MDVTVHTKVESSLCAECLLRHLSTKTPHIPETCLVCTTYMPIFKQPVLSQIQMRRSEARAKISKIKVASQIVQTRQVLGIGGVFVCAEATRGLLTLYHLYTKLA